MTASSAPTSAVSSSWTRILVSVPANGEGISVSTLSVETSRSGSSTSTSSPSALSHRVMVPSVTDSPSAGIVTLSPPETEPPEDPAEPPWPEPEVSASLSSAGSSCSVEGAAWAVSSTVSSVSGWEESDCLACSAAEVSSSPESSLAGASPSPITARSAPTSTVSSSSTRISWRVPAAGEGISVSTLSVETSSRGSSTSTESPTDLSQRVTVPSVTDSPRAGIVTRSDMCEFLLR